MINPLPAGRLRRSFDEVNLQSKTTAELQPGTKIIGQPRGVQAVEFGIDMKSPGYNIYVLSESGTGRPAEEIRSAAKARLLSLVETLEQFKTG